MCTISHITNQQNSISHAQRQVKELLNWNHEQYSNYMFETGMAYLSAYFSGNEALIEMLAPKKVFWQWFKNQWHERDEAFIECNGIDSLGALMRERIYKNIVHDCSILVAELTIPRIVYGEYSTTLKMKV